MRAGASSSTSRTRMAGAAGMEWCGHGGICAERDGDAHLQPATGAVAEFELVVAGVKMREARAGVAEANALTHGRRRVVGETVAVVSDDEFEPAVGAPGLDGDVAAFLARFDAVADGVLDERLEDEPRHKRVTRERVNGEVHLEALVEAGLFDFE